MKRNFNTLRATLLVVANAIGTGIFTTTGFALADVGDPTLVFLIWVLGAAYSLIGVACYQELHRIYPGSGGEYNFLSRGLHPFFGHFAGWVSLIAGFSAPIAASSMGFSLYIQKAFGTTWIPPVVLSSLVIAVIFIFHGLFSQTGFKVHDRFVWGKIFGMAVLIALAAFWAPWDAPLFLQSPSTWKMGAIAGSFFWIAYSYSGWNAVYYIASEMEGEGGSDENSVKKASYWGTLCVCALYLCLNAVLLFSIDVTPLVGSPEVVGTYLNIIFGSSAGRWLSVLIAFGLLSCASALFISGPRVYARMAEDGVLPKAFKVPIGEIPKNATYFQAALALLFLWSAQFDSILKFVGYSMAICSVLSVSIVLFYKKTSWLIRALAAVFCVCTTGLVVQAIPGNQEMIIGVIALIILSGVSYLLQRRYTKRS